MGLFQKIQLVNCKSWRKTVFHSHLVLRQKTIMGMLLYNWNGDHLAVATGITVISDFRQNILPAGGEGAPLAYGDYLLLAKLEDKNIAKLRRYCKFYILPANAGNTEF